MNESGIPAQMIEEAEENQSAGGGRLMVLNPRYELL